MHPFHCSNKRYDARIKIHSALDEKKSLFKRSNDHYFYPWTRSYAVYLFETRSKGDIWLFGVVRGGRTREKGNPAYSRFGLVGAIERVREIARGLDTSVSSLSLSPCLSLFSSLSLSPSLSFFPSLSVFLSLSLSL